MSRVLLFGICEVLGFSLVHDELLTVPLADGGLTKALLLCSFSTV